jgi:cysteine desulfurase
MSAAYLDHNATTQPLPQAIEAMTLALAQAGNPSSIHAPGRAARRLVEEARERVARLVGADENNVVFTSGGTEANVLALSGFPGRRVMVSAIEHPSVKSASGAEALPVLPSGVIDLAALEKALARNSRPALVALMLANNETGVIQPVAEAAAIAHRHGALIHCDAVQASGRIEVDIKALGADTLSLSAHKIGGPQGVGALVLASPAAKIAPRTIGGGQENGLRAGTENVPGIAGFGVACDWVRNSRTAEAARIGRLRDELEARARDVVPTLVVFGADKGRLPNTSCLAVPGFSARTIAMALDLDGVAVSAGAACAAGKHAPSPVLLAMGAGVLAESAIRVSLGWTSREVDLDKFLAAFGRAVGRQRQSGAGDRNSGFAAVA